jgi:hypothetical protein
VEFQDTFCSLCVDSGDTSISTAKITITVFIPLHDNP